MAGNIEVENPYAFAGNWYKGAIHTHTIESDGMHSPQEVIQWYKQVGYDFIAITDHLVLSDYHRYSSADFLIIDGEELYSKMGEVLSLDISVQIPELENLAEQVLSIRKQDGLAIISHPDWYGTTVEQLEEVDGYIGVEIYNNLCELLDGRGSSLKHWDYLLSRGRKVWGFASDDSHKLPEQGDKGWIKVKATRLSLGEILKALENGAFYSSQGPDFYDLKVVDNRLWVKFSAVCELRFIGVVENGMVGDLSAPRVGEGFREGSYEIKGTEKYVRVEIRDGEGKCGWSNPVFVKKIKGK